VSILLPVFPFKCLVSIVLKFSVGIDAYFSFHLTRLELPACHHSHSVPLRYCFDCVWVYDNISPSLGLACNGGSLKDDDLAGRMGLQPKELNKVIALLSSHRLVQVYVISTLLLFTPNVADNM